MENMLANLLLRYAERREPDVDIKKTTGDYLKRWYIIPRNHFFNIYLHQFNGSDDDRAPHDHPWINMSYVLKGSYIEHIYIQSYRIASVKREAGDIKVRLPTTPHMIFLENGEPCWTLFITGPRLRKWGFWTKNVWIHHEVFLND